MVEARDLKLEIGSFNSPLSLSPLQETRNGANRIETNTNKWPHGSIWMLEWRTDGYESAPEIVSYQHCLIGCSQPTKHSVHSSFKQQLWTLSILHRCSHITTNYKVHMHVDIPDTDALQMEWNGAYDTVLSTAYYFVTASHSSIYCISLISFLL